jgi:BMFP domain-containing protein YqiC
VLTTREREKVAICNKYITNPKLTYADLAKELQLSVITVKRAIAWGKEREYFITDTSEKIRRNIISMQSHLDILQREYYDAAKEAQRRRREEKKYNREQKKAGEKTGNIHFSLTRTLTSLSKTILDYQTRIMELEGLYGRLHEGLMPTDSKLSDPLVQMLIQVTGPVYNIKISGNGKNGKNGTNGTNGNGKKDFSANSK